LILLESYILILKDLLGESGILSSYIDIGATKAQFRGIISKSTI